MALTWFALNVISIMVLAFYSMMEMACVTLNKARLQYYVSQGIKQAIWLNYLLKNPSRLFGTTLIGVNIALFVGSECSREFHSALGIDPDFSPLSQVILVVIFGELAPMFAARRYAEHMAMLGVPLIYGSAKIMTPFLWILGAISRLCNMIIGGKEAEANIFLTEEELQKILEEQDEERSISSDADFNAIAANIFSLRSKRAKEIMKPIASLQLVPSHFTVNQARQAFVKNAAGMILISHQEMTHIVGIARPRDLIRAPGNRKVRDYAIPPWFVTDDTHALQILKQFRRNNQRLAVILDKQGKAVGVIRLDDIMEEIFGETTLSSFKRDRLLIERTFPAGMTVREFNKQYKVVLDEDVDLSLVELMEKYLGHYPTSEDYIQIGLFELKVKEASLLDVKTITVSSRL